ncbi:MAG: hypothetical protein IJI57_04130 [Flexilinea sp.]|nr:hypothetical protein [Flexilinea sp.]
MSRYLAWKRRAMLASLGGWWIPTGLTNENVIAAYRFRGVETESLAFTDLTQHGYGLVKRGSNIGWSSSLGLTSLNHASNAAVVSGSWPKGSLCDTKTGNGKWLHRENIRAVVFKYANNYPYLWKKNDNGDYDWIREISAYYAGASVNIYGLSHLAVIQMSDRHHLENSIHGMNAWWDNVYVRRQVSDHTVWLWQFGDQNATIGLNVETMDSSNKLYKNGSMVTPQVMMVDDSAGRGWYDFDNPTYPIWGDQNDAIETYDEDTGAWKFVNTKVATDPVRICDFNDNGGDGRQYAWELCAMAFYNVELTAEQHAEIAQKMSDI